MKSVLSILLLPLLMLTAEAKDPAQRIDDISKAREGRAVLLKSKGGMDYFLRIPRGYDEEDGARLVVFLHGSNKNGLQYLSTIEGNRWCREDILVCPNGDESGENPLGAHNFGFQSAGPVAELTKEVQAALSVNRTYIGGHSQGGFVTFSAIMHNPEIYDGAFPMAGDCWMENEPNLWENNAEKLAEQRDIAIAIIHGQADPVVSFSQGQHAHGIFLAMAYPKLRFFTPEKLGHQFGLSPVAEALEWLDAMTGVDGREAMDLSKKWFRDEEWGWAHQAALAVAADEDADFSSVGVAKRAIEAVEKEAVEATARMEASIGADTPKVWIPKWYEFRRQFGATAVAADLVNRYDEARMKERQLGAQLFNAARGQRSDQDQRNAILQRILDEAPHSFHAWYALDWLGD